MTGNKPTDRILKKLRERFSYIVWTCVQKKPELLTINEPGVVIFIKLDAEMDEKILKGITFNRAFESEMVSQQFEQWKNDISADYSHIAFIAEADKGKRQRIRDILNKYLGQKF